MVAEDLKESKKDQEDLLFGQFKLMMEDARFKMRIQNFQESTKDKIAEEIVQWLSSETQISEKIIEQGIDIIFRVESSFARRENKPREVSIRFISRGLRDRIWETLAYKNCTIAEAKILILKDITYEQWHSATAGRGFGAKPGSACREPISGSLDMVGASQAPRTAQGALPGPPRGSGARFQPSILRAGRLWAPPPNFRVGAGPPELPGSGGARCGPPPPLPHRDATAYEIRRRRRPYKELTARLREQGIRYKWLFPEGISFSYKGKSYAINSVEKIKQFLQEFEEDLGHIKEDTAKEVTTSTQGKKAKGERKQTEETALKGRTTRQQEKQIGKNTWKK